MDLLNTAREFQFQAQSASKRRKVRNDHVQVSNLSRLLFEEWFGYILLILAQVASRD